MVIKREKRGVWMVLLKGLFSGVTLFSLSFSFLLFLVSSADVENTKRFQEKATNVYNAKATRVIDDLNPYAAGPRDPIRWGGLPEVVTGFINRSALEKHNLVIRITKSGLEEIGNFISDGLKSDPSFANLVNFLAMSFLDMCPDSRVIVDTWDNWEEFQRFLTEQYGQKPDRYRWYRYYQEVVTQACGISPSSPGFSYGEGTTHCFGNDIFFEYLGGYNPTGTWDDTTKTCKDDGKGIFSMCLPIPLLNDEGAPLCVNAIVYGQERNKQISYPPSIWAGFDDIVSDGDPAYNVPKCSPGVDFCSTGDLLISRNSLQDEFDPFKLKPEPNEPNTISTAPPCFDDPGFPGEVSYHQTESIEKIEIRDLSGTGTFQPGGPIAVIVHLFCDPNMAYPTYLSDRVKILYSSNADSPTFTLKFSSAPCAGPGYNIAIATFNLDPVPGRHVIRVMFQQEDFLPWEICAGGGSGKDGDTDDLVFWVGVMSDYLSKTVTYFSGGFVWSPFGKCAKDKPDKCPTSQGWINDYFLDRIAGSRLIMDWNRNKVRVFLRPNVGEDHPATWQCEGDMTEHTSDDYLEIGMELQNFEVAVTFASPFVDSPAKYVDCNWVSGLCQFKDGVTTFPDKLSYCFKNRAAVSDNHICDPQYDRYDPEHVISNYINGRAYIRIPIITLKAGIQLKGLFADWTIYQDWEHTIRALGINLKAIDVSAGVAYDFEPMSASVTTPACWSTSWNQVGSVSYCPEYRVSQKFAKTLQWLDAVVRMIALDTFNTACVPTPGQQYSTCIGYFLSPSQLFSFKGLVEGGGLFGFLKGHPLEEMVYVGPTTYYEHKPNRIFFDFGFTNDFWADSAGIIIAANVGVDIRYMPWCSGLTTPPATKEEWEKVKKIPLIAWVKDSRMASACGYDYTVFTMPTCVQFASFLTPATSQIVPIPECDIPAGAGSCPPPPYTSVDTCSIVNGGSSQYVFKTELLPTAPDPPTLGEGRYGYSITNYYIGIGIHHNLISRVLYEAIGDGLACIWIDKYTPQLGQLAGNFLKTDSFGFLIPQLKDRYPGKNMAIEIIPNYKDPGGAYGFGAYPKPASVVAYAKTGGPTFRPVLSVYTQSSTRANFWNEFVQNATYGSSFTMFVQPSTWFDTADLMIDIPYLDLSFNVVTTGTITDPMASQTWMRVFGLTVGIRLSLDLDIVPCVSPDCGKTVVFPGPDTIDFSKSLTSYYRDYYGNPVDPAQGGNYFPEGFTFARVIDLTVYVDPDVRYFIAYNTNALGLSGSDWEGILANILPVILNGVAGAKLRLALDDLPTLIIGALLGNAALLGNTTTSRIGWALRTLRAPIELNFPWVGPEFGSSLMWDKPFADEPSKDNVGDYFEIFIHWRGRYQRLLTQLMFALTAALAGFGGGEGSGILNFLSCDSDKDGFEDLRCGGDDCNDFNRDINPKAFDDCDGIDNDCDGLIDEGNCDNMPPGSCGPLPLDYKVCTCGDADDDGYRNSFCGGNDCNDLNQFINPGMVDYCGDGIDQDCDGSVDEDTSCDCEIVLQCLYRTAPAPKAVNLQSGNGFKNGSENGERVSRSLTPPETFITYTSDPHALYTKIEFAAWSPNSSKFRYSWRLDGGTWNLWQRENSVVLHHLLEGWHVFEVRAQDENKLIDPTPARYVFRIDSLGPDIRLTAPEMVRGSKFKAFIDVQDAQAQKSETLVSWKLNDGEWSEWIPASELTSIEINSLAKGEHILHIRAKDDVGNISTYSHRFFVSEKPRVLGCSSTGGASFGFLLIFIIFISLRFPFSAIAKRK